MISECLFPEIVPALAACGLDFFIIDTEHSPASLHEIESLARVCRQFDIAPLVRVTDNDYALIARALDCGAAGIVIPRLESAAEARRAVEAAKYTPTGRRGCWMRSIIADSSGPATAEDLEKANRETIVVVQVENEQALADLENIVQVPGVDATLVGPQDLSISLGIAGQVAHPRMTEAFARVVGICNTSPVAPGIHMDAVAPLAQRKAEGFRLLSYSYDVGLLAQALKQGVEALRGVSSSAKA
jgi:2-keto-3-deoxy-L-rhamnonate aldolase RhmA